MKSRAWVVLVVAGSLAAALTAARGFNYSRQQRIESGRFAAQYEGSLQQLQGARIALANKRQPIGKYISPAVVAEPVVAEPVAAPAADEGESAVLQGISWSSAMPLAMINNRLYKAGDKIGSSLIQEISPQLVVLMNADGVRREITLIREKKP